jgi:hypothetical protein
MVSPREKPSCDRHSPSTATVIIDEGTIRTSRRKARCKSSFLARQLSVLSHVGSSSEMVLQTMKHMMIYFGSGPLLGGNSPTSSDLVLKMNRCYKGVSRELEKFVW